MTNLSRRDAVLAAAALAACTPNQIAATTPSAEPEQLADIADAVVRPALAEKGIPAPRSWRSIRRAASPRATGASPIAKPIAL